MKRWNALYALLAHLYDRYLRGVCIRRMGQTLISFYGFVGYLLLHAGLSTERTATVTLVATAAAALVYLIIPKSQQALADNLLDNAQAHQAQAAQIEDKVLAAVAIHHSGTVTEQATEQAAEQTGPLSVSAMPGEGREESNADAAAQPQ